MRYFIHKSIGVVAVTICLSLATSATTVSPEVAQLRRQFVEYYAALPVNDAEVGRLLNAQSVEGTWPDVDYASKRRGAWPTLLHLKRTLMLSMAYVSPASRFSQNPELRQAILMGLSHWVDNDYTNPNWWQPKIGIPQTLLKCLVLLGDEVPEDLLRRARPLLRRSKIGMTGQNKVWLSGVAFMKALLAEDPEGMKTASDSIWEELRVTTEEGIQPDWSFHQHGPQLQMGNYGLSFGETMILWGTILRQTPYALSGTRLETLRNYLLNGASWFVWNGMQDVSGCGRQIDAGQQSHKGRAIERQLRQMALIDPARAADYALRLAAPNQLVGLNAFWRSETVLQRRPNWFASVKMSSTRIVGAETCNNENMRGLHLGDGTLLVHLTGREYEDIFPLWDWHRLPGTTCDQGFDELTPHGYNRSYGDSDFSGVLGNGVAGAATMIYQRNGLSARKAWFFQENSILCMGAGIEGKSQGAVYTSIQQSLQTSEVRQGASWVHHGGVGYRILEGTPTWNSGVVDGNWLPCFPTRPDRPVQGDLFSLWIDHGRAPEQATYAYVIYPNVEARDMDRVVHADSTMILRNTRSLQAIEGPNGVFAVFYEPGQFTTTHGVLVQSDSPCLMQWTHGELIVTDPSQSQSALTVTIDEKAVRCNLPTGPQSGRPLCVSLSSGPSN